MDAPLHDCTSAVQCTAVRIVWEYGVKTVEIRRKLLAQYGFDNSKTQRKADEYVEMFQAERKKCNQRSCI